MIGYLGVLFCFDTKRAVAVFTMICAAATQHISYRVYSCLMIALGIGYGAESSWLIVLVTLLTGAVVYLVFVRRIREPDERFFQDKANIAVGGIVIMANIVLHFLVEMEVTFESAPRLFVLFSCYNLICCLLTLMIEHGLFRNRVLVNDKELLERLISQQEEKYRSAKDSMEMINIKCHDIKHQLSRLAADRETIQEMESLISIYDANLKTGNETLDICLMEKKLLCEKNSISFDCIVDGACISFMKPADIFSLFGNAMDNAMEASCKIPDTKKRIISLAVKAHLGMAVIHLENNFVGDLVFDDDLPKTTKGDDVYHGFGVRSIRMVAEKYKGNMSVLVRGHVFNLNITIPIPPEDA